MRDAVVEPGNEIVSLLTTVSEEHATTSQVNTLDHADTPGAVPEQVLVKVLPEIDV